MKDLVIISKVISNEYSLVALSNGFMEPISGYYLRSCSDESFIFKLNAKSAKSAIKKMLFKDESLIGKVSKSYSSGYIMKNGEKKKKVNIIEYRSVEA